ncbi:MAG: HAD family hydrolase [Deltaproteobacteria bacterium]|nr:HAD family hydrolase [Deltaproteobacteria bacterium]
MKYEAIIFDMDGTLLDTLVDIANSVNSVLEKNGFPTHDPEAFRYLVGDGVRKLMDRIIPKENRDEATVGRCMKEYSEIYHENFNMTTQPYKGVPEMLDGLTERRIKKSILSNKPDDFTRKCVDEFLSRWEFETIMGHHDTIPLKPDPAGALFIARKMDIEPDHFLYLGDTGVDMRTAVNARMFPVGALWGFRTEDELIKNGAKALIKEPYEIFRLLD